MTKLTDTAIRGTLQPGKYGDGGGLWLLVGPTSARSWVFRYKLGGRERSMGLGAYPAVSLAKARQEAQRHRQTRALGGDPLAVRGQEREQMRLEASRAVTFEEAAKRFIASRKDGWKNEKYAQQWPDSFEDYVYPFIGKLPVAAVDGRWILEILEQDVPQVLTAEGKETYPAGKFWTARAYTASRVLSRIEQVLDRATFDKFRQGDNPARWRGNLEFALQKTAKTEHHAALPFEDVSAFLRELREKKGSAPMALEFLIFTAARTGEVLGAVWDEISEDGQTWTIPADRMKSGRGQRVPLSTVAQAVVAQARASRRGEYIFPAASTKKPMSNMSLLALLRRMKRTDITPHGFRSTFKDWAAECTSFPNELTEMALAHTIGNKTEAAYRRGDLFEKRRALMEAWAGHCNGRDNVIDLHADGRAA